MTHKNNNSKPKATESLDGFEQAYTDVYGGLSGAPLYRAALVLTGRGPDAIREMKRHRPHQAALAGDALEFCSQLQTPYAPDAAPFFGELSHTDVARELETIIQKANQ